MSRSSTILLVTGEPREDGLAGSFYEPGEFFDEVDSGSSTGGAPFVLNDPEVRFVGWPSVSQPLSVYDREDLRQQKVAELRGEDR